MQKKVSIVIPIILALIVAAGIFWFWQQDDNDQVATDQTKTDLAATLSYQQGEVLVKISESDWQEVETDTILHQDDAVKTGLDSKAIIELENGDVIRLGYNTEISLKSLLDDTVTLDQLSGATYNRVAKIASRSFQVETGGITIESLGTAFDVVDSGEQVKVAVVESKVKILTDNSQQEITEGNLATIIKENKEISVGEIDKDDLTNEWYTWNKEQDSKKTDDLGVLKEYAGPTLTITSPDNGVSTTDDSLEVAGTVSDADAKITVNNQEVANDNGSFSKTISLSAGKNVITIIAEDANGYRTIKEIKVIYQVQVAATPIELKAETETDGVHLSWNASSGQTFQYYKVVRSEDNADLQYPDNGHIAKKDKGQESYVDTDVSEDKNYYYRVCEVMSDNNIFCSNIAFMQGKKVVPIEEVETKEEEAEVVEESGITLSGTAQNDGIHLSWNVTDLTIEHGFKLVKSDSINPIYPGNDYKYLSDASTRGYTWALTEGATYHFRVCQYNGSGQCLVYSNDITVTANNVVPQYTGPVLSAEAEETGVGLWWTDKSDLPGFKYYKVVRSETKADLKYPDDGYIAAISAGVENYRDFGTVDGKSYYYRICAVGDSVYCSNVVQVTAINENSVPAAVTLSASYSSGILTLSWTKSNENDFRYYKVVWSQVDATPEYPNDGYLSAISKASTVAKTDDGAVSGSRKTEVDLSEGTHYYSVCVVDQAYQITCSNTVTLTEGIVQ